jgi:hypothetical protein
MLVWGEYEQQDRAGWGHVMNTASKCFAAVLLVGMVGGCATSYIRYVNSSSPSQQQWAQDRYSCLQQTQQRVSTAVEDQYGGAASSVVMPSCSAFNACLAARGYLRSDTTNVADLNLPGSFSVPEGAKIQCNQ